MDFRLIISLAELIVLGTGIAVFISVYISMARSIIGGAPFVPMSKRYVEPLLDIAAITPEDTLVDLGCGDGRIIDAALKRGVGNAIGYEVSWWPLYLARRRLKLWGNRATLFQKDARKSELSSATIVYMYLLPKIVDKLAPHLADKLSPGARVLSASFPINLTKHTDFRLLEERNIGRYNGYLYERV